MKIVRNLKGIWKVRIYRGLKKCGQRKRKIREVVMNELG